VEPLAGMPILWESFQDDHIQQFENAFDGSDDVPGVVKRIVRQKVNTSTKPVAEKAGGVTQDDQDDLTSIWKDADFKIVGIYENWGVRFDIEGKLLPNADPCPKGLCAHIVKYPFTHADGELCAGCGCVNGKTFKDDETTHADDTRKRVDFLGGDKTYLKLKRGDPMSYSLKNAMRQQQAMTKREIKYTHPLMDWCDRFRNTLIETEETSMVFIPAACAPVKNGIFCNVEQLAFPKNTCDFDMVQKVPLLKLFETLASKIYEMEEVASYEIIRNRLGNKSIQGNVKPCELSGDLLVLHQTGYPDLIKILNAIHERASVSDDLTVSYNAVRRVMGHKTDEKESVTFNVETVKLELQRKLKTFPHKIKTLSIYCIMDLFKRIHPRERESEVDFKTRIVDLMIETVVSQMPSSSTFWTELRSELS